MSGAEEQRDSALPYFLIYDFCVVCVLAGAIGGRAYLVGYTPEMIRVGSECSMESQPLPLLVGSCSHRLLTPLFTLSVRWMYYGKLAYALLSFPFLIFMVPLWGPALHRSKMTG